jgi:hypothetical protein
MLTLEDCLGLCELTEQEVLAIAHHEHVPEMAALELGNYLVHAPGGEMRIKSIIRDDIAEARLRGHRSVELALKLVLRDFVLQHPRCDERCRAHVRLPERRLEGNQASRP